MEMAGLDSEHVQCFTCAALASTIAMEQSCLIYSHIVQVDNIRSHGVKASTYSMVDERFVCANERNSEVMKVTRCKGWKSIK